MAFFGRIGDAWRVLTGVVEVKYDGTVLDNGALGVVLAEPMGGEYKYDISAISGDLNAWVELNITPAGESYTIDGDVVITRGHLPVKEIV